MKPSDRSDCLAAQSYYLDYQSDPTWRAIPTVVAEHIQGCTQCQNRSRQVSGLLRECSRDSEADGSGTLWLRSMKMHFKYLGEPVDCRVARFFMPSLLLPGLALRVPTPITSHIQRCKKCSERMQWLKKSQLTIGQLQRLHLLVVDEGKSGGVQAGEAVLDRLARLDFAGLTEREMSQSLRQSDWFGQVYERREAVWRPDAKGHADGGHLRDNQIFDLIVPECDGSVAQPGCQADIDHVRACPDCHARLQLLYLEFYVFLTDRSVNLVTISRLAGPQDRTDGAAMQVEVVGQAAPPEAVPVPHSRLTRRRILVGMTTAAAAVLIFGFISILNPGAQAVDPAQINREMAGIPLLKIETWTADARQTVSEYWLDRNREQSCYHIGDQIVFHDLKKGIRIIRGPAGIDTITKLNDRQITIRRRQMVERANYHPGFELNQSGSGWVKVKDNTGQEVYELEPPAVGGFQRKFQIELEPGTHFICFSKAYSMEMGKEDYQLETQSRITRLTEPEYSQHITQLGFDLGDQFRWRFSRWGD